MLVSWSAITSTVLDRAVFAQFEFYGVAIPFLRNPSHYSVILEQHLRSCGQEASHSHWNVRSVPLNVLVWTLQHVMESDSEVSSGYDDSCSSTQRKSQSVSQWRLELVGPSLPGFSTNTRPQMATLAY
jgi:hypothetical protein